MQLRRCASTSLQNHTFDLQSKEVASARAELAVERLAGALGGEDPCQQPLTKHELGKAFGSNGIEWVDQIESHWHTIFEASTVPQTLTLKPTDFFVAYCYIPQEHEVYLGEQAVDREFTLPTSVPSTCGIFELSSQCNFAVAHPRSSQTSRF